MPLSASMGDQTDVASRVANGYTLPGSWYTDPTLFELEKRRIFSRAWQYVGVTAEVPGPGDYLVRHVGHIPVLVVRDESGAVRAFLNVCRHRGSLLIDMSREYGHSPDGRALGIDEDVAPFQCRGHRSSFQCPYHAWTYKLDGSLRAAPRSQFELSFDNNEFSLIPARIELAGSLMFVNPDLDAPPLAQTIGTLPQLFADAGVDLAGIRRPRRYRECVYRANWKVTVENFNECYHCPVVHPGLAAALDVADTFKWFEDHDSFSWYGTTARSSGELCHFSFIWPNFGLSSYAGGRHIVTNWMLPLGLDRTVLFREYFFSDAVDDDEALEAMRMTDQLTREDKGLCEGVQRGLETGVFDEGRVLLQSEQGVHQFQMYVALNLNPSLG